MHFLIPPFSAYIMFTPASSTPSSVLKHSFLQSSYFKLVLLFDCQFLCLLRNWAIENKENLALQPKILVVRLSLRRNLDSRKNLKRMMLSYMSNLFSLQWINTFEATISLKWCHILFWIRWWAFWAVKELLNSSHFFAGS